MSTSISTKFLFFSGVLSLLQISTNLMDLAQVSAVSLTRGTGMSKCKQPLVLETCEVSEETAQDSQENAQDSQENAQDSEKNAEDGGEGAAAERHQPPAAAPHPLVPFKSATALPESGASTATNTQTVCESTDLATGGTSSNLNESGVSESYEKMLQSHSKVLRFLQGPDGDEKVCARERAYLLEKHLLIQSEEKHLLIQAEINQIDLSLNLPDGSRLSVLPEAGQNAAFKIAEDSVQETSAASTLVHAQGCKTVGDLKDWIASVRGKSKYFLDVFLPGTEMQLEDTQTLEEIDAEFKASNEASNNTGPVNLFVLERVFSKDALVQDFLEQYSTRLKNFTEIEELYSPQDIAEKIKHSVGSIIQKNEVTVRLKRGDIDTSNTKTSSDDDSSTFYEITFVRQRTSYFSSRGGVVDDDGVLHYNRFNVHEDLYIVFKGATRQSIYYDVMNNSWSLKTNLRVGDTRVKLNEDVGFRNNFGFHEQAWYARNQLYLMCASSRLPDLTLNIPDLGEMTWAKLFTTFLIYVSFSRNGFDFSDLLIPAWEDFAVEFHNESAGAPSLDREPIPDSQRLITKTGAGEVKIYDSDRQYYEKVEEKVSENWEGLRIVDVIFKQT